MHLEVELSENLSVWIVVEPHCGYTFRLKLDMHAHIQGEAEDYDQYKFID